MRFEITGKGTVIDTQTGLEWQAEPADLMTWDEAMDYAENLDLGGYDDWQLPTRTELETLVDLDRYNPASAFPGMPSEEFWSSSVFANDASYAWYVSFYYGYVSDLDEHGVFHVRCVCRGPLKYRH